MTHANFELIDQFFAAYGRRDAVALRKVLADNVTWTFREGKIAAGRHLAADQYAADEFFNRSAAG